MPGMKVRSSRAAVCRMLGLLIGQELSDSVKLAMPAPKATAVVSRHDIQRPELELFRLQKELLDVEEKKLRSGYLPKLSAFFQGAWGRPMLNIISDEFGPWYITGASFTWTLGSLSTLKNDTRNMEIKRPNMGIERDNISMNIRPSHEQAE